MTATAQQTVMVIEDEEAFIDALVVGLQREGFGVQVARDGAEALTNFDKVNPDIVLLDLNLPKVSGQEVLRRLRADMRTKMVPVVVLTNSKEELDVVASYSHGANSYVRKPVDFLEFMSLVRTLSQYWLVVNVNPLQKPGG